jgi:3-oxoacyl-[acyl-carrier-protein] synthase-3
MSDAYITRTSVSLPNQAVENDQVEAILGQVGERPSRARRVVQRNNGIRRRYYVIDPGTGLATHSNASLTAEAVRGLTDEHFALEDIAVLACGTSNPDQLMPNHAVMVHGELCAPIRRGRVHRRCAWQAPPRSTAGWLKAGCAANAVSPV